jgi:hypothetical protein
MTVRLRCAAGPLVALAALGLAGCGGSGASTVTATTGSASVSAGGGAAQFSTAATRICEGVHAQQEPLQIREESFKGQLGRSAASADLAFASLARQAAAIAQTGLGRLVALPRPHAQALAIEQVLQAYSEQVGDANTIASAAASGQNSRGEAASAALARSIAAHGIAARRLGMGECFGLE